MDDLTDVDFRFTGFLAEQQARYRTYKGRADLEKERRPTHRLSPVENQWRRMNVKAQKQQHNERHAA